MQSTFTNRLSKYQYKYFLNYPIDICHFLEIFILYTQRRLLIMNGTVFLLKKKHFHN